MCGWYLAKNIISSHRNFFNLPRGLKDISQKADFEREHTRAHSCHIMKKVAF